MYLDHFSLNSKPFRITTDPNFIWLGEKHEEALANLKYGILDNRGFLLLTGEVGTGKTILVNCLTKFLEMDPDSDTVVATLPDPNLELMDFYNYLADEFGWKRTFDKKGEFLIQLRNFLNECYANKQQVLLIIDESQRLTHSLMENIRVLSNIELHDHKLINIFFVGQPEFNNLLMKPENRGLSQRITIRYNIEPLDEKETGDYIHHRLKVAGSNDRIFNKSAVGEVFQVSGGIPRLINIVCDHALLTAFIHGANKVDGKIIKECAEELRIPLYHPQMGVATVRSANTQMNKENVTPSQASKTDIIANHHKDATNHNQIHWSKSPAIWWVAFAIVFFIGGLGFFIGKFTGGFLQKNNEDKYKYSTQLEKPLPQDRLTDGDTQTDEPSIPELTGDAKEKSLPFKNPAERIKLVKKEIPSNDSKVIIDTAEGKKSAVEKPLLLRKEKNNIPFENNSNKIDKPAKEKTAGPDPSMFAATLKSKLKPVAVPKPQITDRQPKASALQTNKPKALPKVETGAISKEKAQPTIKTATKSKLKPAAVPKPQITDRQPKASAPQTEKPKALPEMETGAISKEQVQATIKTATATDRQTRSRILEGTLGLTEKVKPAGRIIKTDHPDAAIWEQKSYTAAVKGNIDQAISDATKAIELDPGRVYSYINRSWAYIEKNMLENAIQDCETALLIEPQNMRAFNNRGLAYERGDQLTKAQADYRRACDLGLDLGCRNLDNIINKYESPN